MLFRAEMLGGRVGHKSWTQERVISLGVSIHAVRRSNSP